MELDVSAAVNNAILKTKLLLIKHGNTELTEFELVFPFRGFRVSVLRDSAASWSP